MSTETNLEDVLRDARKRHEEIWDYECLSALKNKSSLTDLTESIFCSRIPELHEYPIDIQISYHAMIWAFPAIIFLLILVSAIRRWKIGNTKRNTKITFWCAALIPLVFLSQTIPTVEKAMSPYGSLLPFLLLFISFISWLFRKKRTGAEGVVLRIMDITILITVIVFIAGQIMYTRFQLSDAKILKRQVYWDYIEQQKSSE